MEHYFKASHVCPTGVIIEVEGDIIKSARLDGRGCPGNSKALSALVQGMNIDKLDTMLGGNTCGDKPTSCIDQIIKAAKAAREQQKQTV